MPIQPKSLLQQQLQEGEKMRTEWPWRLLIFSVIVSVLTAFIYAGMAFGYQPYLNSQNSQLDSQISALSAKADSSDMKSLLDLYSQIVNIQTLLTTHRFPSKILDFLENHTDNSVYYTDAAFTFSDKNLKLDGHALDYNALVRQLEVFKSAPEIKSLSFGGSSKNDKGNIVFNVTLNLDPKLFSSH